MNLKLHRHPHQRVSRMLPSKALANYYSPKQSPPLLFSTFKRVFSLNFHGMMVNGWGREERLKGLFLSTYDEYDSMDGGWFCLLCLVFFLQLGFIWGSTCFYIFVNPHVSSLDLVFYQMPTVLFFFFLPLGEITQCKMGQNQLN